jgi:transcription elongation factor GreA
MPTTAQDLFRATGLLPDGPMPWGRPVAARGSGVFVVELATPLPAAPIALTRVGKWVERVPELRLDGERPTSRALAARLASFWLPDQVVVYIGTAETSLGGRIAALEATTLGDRRPHAGGHWLRTLDVPPGTRIWWAATDAVEEYEDALLTAFAEGVQDDPPSDGPVLPFANLRRPTGERRPTGLTGSLLPEPVVPPTPPTRVTIVPDGDAEGARGEPPPPRPRTRRPAPPPTRATGSGATAPAGADAGVTLTAAGAARLQGELEELMRKRPDVVRRIATAREHGDLKENAEYHAAREEQGFLEGRIRALEARLRLAVIAEEPGLAAANAVLGSVVTVESEGVDERYTLVGSAEANIAAGRLSVASPVGRALLGAAVGDEVVVETPRGPVTYRVTELA